MKMLMDTLPHYMVMGQHMIRYKLACAFGDEVVQTSEIMGAMVLDMMSMYFEESETPRMMINNMVDLCIMQDKLVIGECPAKWVEAMENYEGKDMKMMGYPEPEAEPKAEAEPWAEPESE